jgi:MFS family permease
VLRDRALSAVAGGWAATCVAATTSTIALTVASYDAGGTSGVAATLVLRTLPSAASGPLVGALLRRVPAGVVMVLATCVAAAATAACALAPGSLPALVLLGLVLSVALRAARVAQQTALPQLSSGAVQLTATNVLLNVLASLALVVGPALAAGVLAVGDVRAAFLLSAAAFLVGAAPLLPLRWCGAPAGSSRGRAPADRRPLRVPVVRLVFGLLAAQSVTTGGLRVLYASVAVGLLSAGPQGVGLLTAGFGIGALVTSVGLLALAGSPRLGAVTALGMLLLGLPLVLAAGVPVLPLVLVAVVLAGAGDVMVDVTSDTLLQRALPTGLLAATFGARQTVSVLGSCAGALLAAWLDVALGTAVALVVLGAPAALAAVLARPALLRLDRDLAAPALRVALLRGLDGFALLPTPQLEAAAVRLQPVAFPAGAPVVVQGEAGEDYWVVADGRLSVVVDGKEVAELGPGEGFGEIALLRDVPRTATVTARTAVQLLRLGRADFLAAVSAHDGSAPYEQVVQARLDRAAPLER